MNPDTFIIARTDAREVVGMDEALRRDEQLRLSGNGVSFEDYKTIIGMPQWSRIEDGYKPFG